MSKVVTQETLNNIYKSNPQFGERFIALNKAEKEYQNRLLLLTPLEKEVFNSFGVDSFDDLYDENTFEIKDKNMQLELIDALHNLYTSYGFIVPKGVSPILQAKSLVGDIVNDLINLHAEFVEPNYKNVLLNITTYNKFKNLVILISNQIVKNAKDNPKGTLKTQPKVDVKPIKFRKVEFDRISELIESLGLSVLNKDNMMEISTYNKDTDTHTVITKVDMEYIVETSKDGKTTEVKVDRLTQLIDLLKVGLVGNNPLNEFKQYFEYNLNTLYSDLIECVNGNDIEFSVLAKTLKLNDIVTIKSKSKIFNNDFAVKFWFSTSDNYMMASAIMSGEIVDTINASNSLKTTFNLLDLNINDLNKSKAQNKVVNMYKNVINILKDNDNNLSELPQYVERVLLGSDNNYSVDKFNNTNDNLITIKTDLLQLNPFSLQFSYNDNTHKLSVSIVTENGVLDGALVDGSMDKLFEVNEKIYNEYLNSKTKIQQTFNDTFSADNVTDKVHIKNINVFIRRYLNNFKKQEEIEAKLDETYSEKGREKLQKMSEKLVKAESMLNSEISDYIRDNNISEDLWYESKAGEVELHYEDFID